jgi:hypothetical protein
MGWLKERKRDPAEARWARRQTLGRALMALGLGVCVVGGVMALCALGLALAGTGQGPGAARGRALNPATWWWIAASILFSFGIASCFCGRVLKPWAGSVDTASAAGADAAPQA